MRTADDFAALRRAHRDGLSIRQIAKQFGVGRDTVRKALEHPEPQPYTRTEPRPAPIFGPFREIVDAILAADEHAPRKQRLARGEWLTQHFNCCLIGNAGTGKTHLATALGLAACRQGKRVRFFTAAGLVTQLEEAQQQHRLDRFLTQLERVDLLICDELGYLSFNRSGAELLFQVFADRYERRSLLITSNLAFGEWGQVFQGERMTAALLDRLTHRCHIFEMNGESYRFRESMKTKKDKDPKKGK